MPGFVKTPKDEARWQRAKKAAAKETKEGSEGFWKLSNYIFHQMGKSEEDQKQAEILKKGLLTPSINPPKVSNPMKTAQVSVKMPKPKKMPDPFTKPSLFFKSEDRGIKKLKSFLDMRSNKKKGS